MSKQDTYPSKTTLVDNDYVTGVDSTGPSTIKLLMSAIKTYIWTLANIPAGGTSPITRDNESQFAFVASGGVWSGDNYGVNRNASMTAMICYINGRRISISAVAARTFTASVDTYIDVLDNGDGTGTLVYTTAVNNSASVALAANSLRIGIIITGATTIANSGSVNQGQESIILPIASSIAYTVTDSLGNLICPRDPSHKIIGYRQITTNFTTTSGSPTQITGVSAPVIIPTGRKIKATFFSAAYYITNPSNSDEAQIWDGTPGSGTQLSRAITPGVNTGGASGVAPQTLRTLSAGSHTLNAAAQSVGSQTLTCEAASTYPAYLIIELE